MSTKSMRLPPRRVLTPNGPTNKRKERDDPFDRPKPTSSKLPKNERPIPRPGSEAKLMSSSTSSSRGGKGMVEPTTSNPLLAGYLAHEYLTNGTLMGQPWAQSREKLKGKEEEDGGGAVKPPCRRSAEEEKERYVMVAGILKGSGGSHLPGVVNPTQLASFLRL